MMAILRGHRLRITRAEARLVADEGGQAAALGVIAAAAFACLLLLVVNTGESTSGKIELQNAADATAISGATWIARGLNVVSMNNVTQTQILAVVLVIRALDDALPQALTVLRAQLPLCKALLVGAPACVAVVTFQIAALQGIRAAVISIGRPLARHKGVLWSAMLALELVSDGVVNGVIAVVGMEADRIARQNGADLGFVVPAGLRIRMPVRKAPMRPELCDPTRRGSPSRGSRGYTPLLGYHLNEGPFERYSRHLGYGFLPFENSLIRVFFNLARESHFATLCGGAGGGSTLPAERPVDSLAQCRQLGGGTATWAIVQYRTVSFDTPQPGLTLRNDNDPRLAGPPRAADPPERRSCAWTPPGVRIGPDRYRSTREIVEQTGRDAQGRPIRRYRYELTDYLFLAAFVPTKTPPAPRGPVASGAVSSDNPDPYVLVRNADEDLRYLAVVYRSRETRVAPDHFESPYGAHRLAYAQARVYNPTAFDTFTQDWRVTLEPASLVEDGTLLSALGSPVLDLANVRDTAALSRFRGSGLFGGFRGDLNFIQLFNNH